ncbi:MULTISPECIES: hypothetical protein [unclassified Burkholderia]|uniref:hypothetical protein n=1 Tax=unclassified Burkholderia TaxID=2613784 RepID=UPI000F595233|nr:MULTISPECIES: hypothetical protein [unclassified Burkholderia]RQS22448.1 hypothetical protein DIE05_29950 [Burkholderia sp. Bp8995]RQS39242.1 hypothetical protein DIE00_34135 [Burkholderia sp. Bp8989]
MDKHYDAVLAEKKEDSLRAARQLSALLLNFSGDPAMIEDHLEGRKEAMFVLMSDLSLKVEAALVEALHD